jgi:dihydrofolate reductase
MSMVTCDIAASVDGYVAGRDRRLENPFGEGVDERLHRWMFDGAEDNAEEIAAVTSAGAYIMGRNMFGPRRGAWDEEWQGWWGPEPPYHAPEFVLTHHPREMLVMEGGTTFTFVTDGTESRSLRRAPLRAIGTYPSPEARFSGQSFRQSSKSLLPERASPFHGPLIGQPFVLDRHGGFASALRHEVDVDATVILEEIEPGRLTRL